MAGRPKGAKNRRNMKVEEIADKYIQDDSQDPFAILLMVAANDWKGLGYKSSFETREGKNGQEYEASIIELKDRVMAAKEAARYLYAQKQAVSIDLNSIQKMSDEEFEKYKTEFLKQYVAPKS